MAKPFKIFISHSWAYSEDLESLQRLLRERGYFNVEFLEASKKVPINSEHAPYIKRVLNERILDSNIEYKNKELWIKYMLEDVETSNTQKIADLILNEAIDNNYGVAKDDMSIIVCKFRKKEE